MHWIAGSHRSDLHSGMKKINTSGSTRNFDIFRISQCSFWLDRRARSNHLFLVDRITSVASVNRVSTVVAPSTINSAKSRARRKLKRNLDPRRIHAPSTQSQNTMQPFCVFSSSSKRLPLSFEGFPAPTHHLPPPLSPKRKENSPLSLLKHS